MPDLSKQALQPRNRRERRAAAAGHLRTEPASWRIPAWLHDVPISRSRFYELKNAGKIKTVKVGASTLVITSPREFLAAQAEA
jgi:hypothetical protein